MEEKYIEVNGIRTRYLEAGAGEPLLLVHGGHFGMNDSANDWDTVIDGFARDFHVIAPDKIGLGFSDNPRRDRDYLMKTMVQHVYDFLCTVGIDRSHVVGHSRGSYAVIRLALEHPEAVNTLTIVDCGTLVLARNPIYDQWEAEAALIPDKRERTRYSWAANSFSPAHITDDLLDRLLTIDGLPKSQEAVEKMKAGLMQQFKEDLAVEQKETQERIKKGEIKVPTLIAWGYNDPSAKLDPMGYTVLRLFFESTPKCEMHILNQAGHWSFREQPESFVTVVAGFIKAN